MDKDILNDYIDACELVKETEKLIRRLKARKTVTTQESVKGSNPDWPYQEQHFTVHGIAYTYEDDRILRGQERTLQIRKDRAQELKLQVDAWMNTIPFRMQRIIRYKVFDGYTWEQVAAKLGRNATGDSVKKEYQRFLKKI